MSFFVELTRAKTKEIKDIQYSYPDKVNIDIELSKGNNTPDDIKIYPNPCTDHIQITSGETIVEYTLIDIAGKVNSTHKVNTFGTIIDTAELPSGIYIIEIHTTSDTKNRIFTFVKQ